VSLVSAEAGTGASRYLAGGLSEKGRRGSNEDAAILAVLPLSSALRAFAVLCDGMGGHNAGEVASRLATEILKEKIQAFAARPGVPAPPARAEIEAEVREWVAEVNREIYQRGKSSAEQRGMGTTLALAMVLADDRLFVANVGDSRVFLVSGLNVRQLSVDHTALAEQRRALGSDSVAPEDDASNPFAHALTRSVGQEKKVVPDVRSDVVLGTGDVVILTTDGVTDVLEAERFLTALETTGSLQEAAEEIYRLAFEAGSKDNVSVALLSRGIPARLGLGKAGQPASFEPPPSRSGDGMLIAGAASAPPGGSASRPRASRLAAFGVAALALLVVLALGLLLRRPATPPSPPAAVPVTPAAAASTAPPSAAPVPTATLSLAPSPSPSGTEPPEQGARMQATPRLSPQPARVLGEPSFRTPAALSGLKPLEFPPTPTETPTATHTPTPTATDTATPTIPPPPVPGRAPGAPAPPPASPPAMTPAPAPAPASAPTPGVSV
jgi:PPM family protein phosphatase